MKGWLSEPESASTEYRAGKVKDISEMVPLLLHPSRVVQGPTGIDMMP